MKNTAVCIRCGHLKEAPYLKCCCCGFEPATDREKVQSIILSEGFTIGEDFICKSNDELRAIGKDISEGRPFAFDENEIRRVLVIAHEVENTTLWDLLLGLIRLFWPVIPALLILFYLYSKK